MLGTRLSPADALRDNSRGVVQGGSRFSLGHGLVALQVALSFVLVLGSALFVRTFVDLAGQGMGFTADRVMLATIDLRRTGVAADARHRMFAQVREALAAVPGVTSAAASLVTPVSGSTWALGARVPDGPPPPRNSALFNGVTPGYFATLDTPLLAGRDVTTADAAGRPEVVVVNEAFARQHLGVDNREGRRRDDDGDDGHHAGVGGGSCRLPAGATRGTHRSDFSFKGKLGRRFAAQGRNPEPAPQRPNESSRKIAR